MTTQDSETIETLATIISSLRKYTNIEPEEGLATLIAERISRFQRKRIQLDKFWDVHTIIGNHYMDFGYDFTYLVTAELFRSLNRADEIDTLAR